MSDFVLQYEYQQSIAQAFSYAVSMGADFVWATSRINNGYYKVSKDFPRQHIGIIL
jgi:hypothetical protein